jgi:hypothetical protein
MILQGVLSIYRRYGHAHCDNGVVPLICPTCQMVSQDASGVMPAVIGYFA